MPLFKVDHTIAFIFLTHIATTPRLPIAHWYPPNLRILMFLTRRAACYSQKSSQPGRLTTLSYPTIQFGCHSTGFLSACAATLAFRPDRFGSRKRKLTTRLCTVIGMFLAAPRMGNLSAAMECRIKGHSPSLFFTSI